VRPVTEGDRAYLAQLIEGDPYHRDRMTPDFFLKLKRGEDAWAIEGEDGKIILYFKTSTAVRVAIQFTDSSARVRNSKALSEGLAWLGGLLMGNGFRELLFDTESPELRSFSMRGLGFEAAPELLTMTLETPKCLEREPRSLGNVPTSDGEKGGTAYVRS
jgi:hypothetical protein